MRDLVRAREDAVGVGTQAKYRLKAFLLGQGRRYPGREGCCSEVFRRAPLAALRRTVVTRPNAESARPAAVPWLFLGHLSALPRFFARIPCQVAGQPVPYYAVSGRKGGPKDLR